MRFVWLVWCNRRRRRSESQNKKQRRKVEKSKSRKVEKSKSRKVEKSKSRKVEKLKITLTHTLSDEMKERKKKEVNFHSNERMIDHRLSDFENGQWDNG